MKKVDKKGENEIKELKIKITELKFETINLQKRIDKFEKEL